MRVDSVQFNCVILILVFPSQERKHMCTEIYSKFTTKSIAMDIVVIALLFKITPKFQFTTFKWRRKVKQPDAKPIHIQRNDCNFIQLKSNRVCGIQRDFRFFLFSSPSSYIFG